MAHLQVLQHHPAEDPGSMLEWARLRGHRLDIVQPALTPLRREMADIDGLIVLGGPWCAFAEDRPDWLRQEQAWLHEQLHDNVPVFAVCLGAQLVAQALGARLQRMPAPETGWVAVDVCDEGAHHRLEAGSRPPQRPSVLEVLQWHEDRFELPPGCRQIVAGIAADSNSDHRIEMAPALVNGAGVHALLCPIQGYASVDGRIVGLQFHAEWTPATVAALHTAFGNDCPLPPADPPSQRYAPMHAWLHTRLDRWVDDASA
jgi:GMP synthase-like glutamine amidotransferase